MKRSDLVEKLILLRANMDRLLEEAEALEIELEHVHFVAFKMVDRLQRFRKSIEISDLENPDDVLPGQLPLTTTGTNDHNLSSERKDFN